MENENLNPNGEGNVPGDNRVGENSTETMKPETVKVETVKVETVKAETVKAETVKAETKKAEAEVAGAEDGETGKAVLKCPYCDGTEMIEAYQGGYAHIYAIDSSLRGSSLYHLICRDCGTIVRSFVKDPELFVKHKFRRKKASHYTKRLTDYV